MSVASWCSALTLLKEMQDRAKSAREDVAADLVGGGGRLLVERGVAASDFAATLAILPRHTTRLAPRCGACQRSGGRK